MNVLKACLVAYETLQERLRWRAGRMEAPAVQVPEGAVLPEFARQGSEAGPGLLASIGSTLGQTNSLGITTLPMCWVQRCCKELQCNPTLSEFQTVVHHGPRARCSWTRTTTDPRTSRASSTAGEGIRCQLSRTWRASSPTRLTCIRTRTEYPDLALLVTKYAAQHLPRYLQDTR